MASAISVYNLTVSVREKGKEKKLLSNINFEVEGGNFVAVIGSSGCGKSTLVKALAGLIQPTSGEVLFAGRSVADLDEELPLAVGYLPQFGAFHEQLTVKENMETAASLRLPRTVSTERTEKWIAHITELARIESFLPQAYKTLSGGQMRRMALAEELIGDPAFLLLDELTSGLDAFSDLEMMAWLKDLAHNMNKTVVLVTHSTSYLDLCDSILFLHKGRLIHYGDYQSLLESHQVSSIAELFGIYAAQEVDLSSVDQPRTDPPEVNEAVSVKSLPPPPGWTQFSTLLMRQAKLLLREKGQIVLHLALILTFPFLVAVFATSGLPQVRNGGAIFIL